MDRIDPAARSRNMRAIRGRNTGPELTVRHLLHAAGYRYRLHRRDLPGRPDIVLPGRRAIIEVRGCFWHQHGAPSCRNAVRPRTRPEWWAEKLNRNVERDRRNVAALQEAGWRVLIVWECEVGKPGLPERLREFLGAPGSTRPS